MCVEQNQTAFAESNVVQDITEMESIAMNAMKYQQVHHAKHATQVMGHAANVLLDMNWAKLISNAGLAMAHHMALMD